MAHFPKPAAGSWTEHYPHLDTGPVSYEDSISPDYYKLEKEAVFKQCWLNVGRVEQLPRPGSYFTRELEVANTSLILVRGRDDQIRAFHNICRHRGNKLVWTDYPGEEVSGDCRQFTCKYHGWRYGLSGDLTFVQQEDEFFHLDKAAYPLVSVHVDTWEGFIFVNLAAQPPQTLAQFLGEMGAGLAGYPFAEMTHSFGYRADVNANWKLFIDAFAEFYHAPILHMRQAVADEAAKLAQFGFEALHYEIYGDSGHSMVSTWGGMSPPKDPNMVKPIERILRSGLFGPWDKPDIDLSNLPPALNPARHKSWGGDSFQVFPNFVVLVWEPGWYLTYNYWPLSFDRHRFEGRLYFAPPKNATDRLRQELAAVTFKEYSLQDGNTLEATQRMLQSRAVTEFPLCDQEVLCRNLHTVVRARVEAYQAGRVTPVTVSSGGP
ncbi:aromatic ring-hydroxylating oxygenase subunit alpha [Candidatus Poriferisocius sp.]|uniref:aromatic ring-hydroxylating oxygenase subunit alpha n=1 Tax=Candidatus Poriferisocius sp. TaxID=3101276 RepID=UPI003B01052A